VRLPELANWRCFNKERQRSSTQLVHQRRGPLRRRQRAILEPTASSTTICRSLGDGSATSASCCTTKATKQRSEPTKTPQIVFIVQTMIDECDH
jgi:hypothetical protein